MEEVEEFDEDEDVVLEGGALHRMLQDIGCDDFEPILIKRHQPLEESKRSSKPIERLRNFFTQTISQNLLDNRKVSYLSRQQISTILQAETLLDDHSEFVQSLLNKNSQTFWTTLGEWSTLIASTVILGTRYLMQERRKTLVTIVASLMAAIAIHRKYNEFCAMQSLKNLVSLQNELHRLYKKGLRIVSKGCRVKPNSKQTPSGFCNLEIDRLKYIQPLTETLLKSMTSIGRIYHQTSSMIVKILPKSDCDEMFTRFEEEAFSNDGEMMYNRIKQLYYVYIMVQSDVMQLLAVAYDTDTWIAGRLPHSRLTRIIFNLYRLVRSHKMQLALIIESYENCKPRPIQRKFRGPRASKWRDLYLNLELLSRKVATAYDTIGAVLEKLDRHEDTTLIANNDDDFVDELTPRIHDIYKQIDSAKHFAEFSDLLIVILRRSGRTLDNVVSERSSIPPANASDLPIVRDSDPQIIDEVFEEYITEEYLKPLYDESDDAGPENSRLDKLLEKNFMCELKEALVDKYRSMAEREAKALLRKRGVSNCDVREKPKSEESPIPCPPPLPAEPLVTAACRIVAAKRQKMKYRAPVPLPRMSTKPQTSEDIRSDPVVTQQLPLSVPPPPPPPPPPLRVELCEVNERLLIGLPTVGARKMPAFVTFEEEFIGSGENSEEEQASQNDSEKDDEKEDTAISE